MFCLAAILKRSSPGWECRRASASWRITACKARIGRKGWFHYFVSDVQDETTTTEKTLVESVPFAS